MFSRLSQVGKHVAGSSQSIGQVSIRVAGGVIPRYTMATADDRNSRTIHTAACLVIGDEVLNGKVLCPSLLQVSRGDKGKEEKKLCISETNELSA
jgi:hypothetical protein